MSFMAYYVRLTVFRQISGRKLPLLAKKTELKRKKGRE